MRQRKGGMSVLIPDDDSNAETSSSGAVTETYNPVRSDAAPVNLLENFQNMLMPAVTPPLSPNREPPGTLTPDITSDGKKNVTNGMGDAENDGGYDGGADEEASCASADADQNDRKCGKNFGPGVRNIDNIRKGTHSQDSSMDDSEGDGAAVIPKQHAAMTDNRAKTNGLHARPGAVAEAEDENVSEEGNVNRSMSNNNWSMNPDVTSVKKTSIVEETITFSELASLDTSAKAEGQDQEQASFERQLEEMENADLLEDMLNRSTGLLYFDQKERGPYGYGAGYYSEEEVKMFAEKALRGGDLIAGWGQKIMYLAKKMKDNEEANNAQGDAAERNEKDAERIQDLKENGPGALCSLLFIAEKLATFRHKLAVEVPHDVAAHFIAMVNDADAQIQAFMKQLKEQAGGDLSMLDIIIHERSNAIHLMAWLDKAAMLIACLANGSREKNIEAIQAVYTRWNESPKVKSSSNNDGEAHSVLFGGGFMVKMLLKREQDQADQRRPENGQIIGSVGSAGGGSVTMRDADVSEDMGNSIDGEEEEQEGSSAEEKKERKKKKALQEKVRKGDITGASRLIASDLKGGTVASLSEAEESIHRAFYATQEETETAVKQVNEALYTLNDKKNYKQLNLSGTSKQKAKDNDAQHEIQWTDATSVKKIVTFKKHKAVGSSMESFAIMHGCFEFLAEHRNESIHMRQLEEKYVESKVRMINEAANGLGHPLEYHLLVAMAFVKNGNQQDHRIITIPNSTQSAASAAIAKQLLPLINRECPQQMYGQRGGLETTTVAINAVMMSSASAVEEVQALQSNNQDAESHGKNRQQKKEEEEKEAEEEEGMEASGNNTNDIRRGKGREQDEGNSKDKAEKGMVVLTVADVYKAFDKTKRDVLLHVVDKLDPTTTPFYVRQYGSFANVAVGARQGHQSVEEARIIVMATGMGAQGLPTSSTGFVGVLSRCFNHAVDATLEIASKEDGTRENLTEEQKEGEKDILSAFYMYADNVNAMSNMRIGHLIAKMLLNFQMSCWAIGGLKLIVKFFAYSGSGSGSRSKGTGGSSGDGSGGGGGAGDGPGPDGPEGRDATGARGHGAGGKGGSGDEDAREDVGINAAQRMIRLFQPCVDFAHRIAGGCGATAAVEELNLRETSVKILGAAITPNDGIVAAEVEKRLRFMKEMAEYAHKRLSLHQTLTLVGASIAKKNIYTTRTTRMCEAVLKVYGGSAEEMMGLICKWSDIPKAGELVEAVEQQQHNAMMPSDASAGTTTPQKGHVAATPPRPQPQLTVTPNNNNCDRGDVFFTPSTDFARSTPLAPKTTVRMTTNEAALLAPQQTTSASQTAAAASRVATVVAVAAVEGAGEAVRVGADSASQQTASDLAAPLQASAVAKGQRKRRKRTWKKLPPPQPAPPAPPPPPLPRVVPRVPGQGKRMSLKEQLALQQAWLNKEEKAEKRKRIVLTAALAQKLFFGEQGQGGIGHMVGPDTLRASIHRFTATLCAEVAVSDYFVKHEWPVIGRVIAEHIGMEDNRNSVALAGRDGNGEGGSAQRGAGGGGDDDDDDDDDDAGQVMDMYAFLENCGIEFQDGETLTVEGGEILRKEILLRAHGKVVQDLKATNPILAPAMLRSTDEMYRSKFFNTLFNITSLTQSPLSDAVIKGTLCYASGSFGLVAGRDAGSLNAHCANAEVRKCESAFAVGHLVPEHHAVTCSAVRDAVNRRHTHYKVNLTALYRGAGFVALMEVPYRDAANPNAADVSMDIVVQPKIGGFIGGGAMMMQQPVGIDTTNVTSIVYATGAVEDSAKAVARREKEKRAFYDGVMTRNGIVFQPFVHIGPYGRLSAGAKKIVKGVLKEMRTIKPSSFVIRAAQEYKYRTASACAVFLATAVDRYLNGDRVRMGL